MLVDADDVGPDGMKNYMDGVGCINQNATHN